MRFCWLGVLFFFAAQCLAQTRPTTTEIRHGLEIPATAPAERQEAMLEQIARKVEPDLKGQVSRLPAYVEFYKRESVCDPRLFPVDVSAKVAKDGAIQLDGYVEFLPHQQSLELLLKTLGFAHVRNHIVVVSDPLVPNSAPGGWPVLGNVGFGVVSAPRTMVIDRVDKPHEDVTELLFGEPVFVLRLAEGGYYWIHSSDGYVGYANMADIRAVNRDVFTAYQHAAHGILRRDCESPLGVLPTGARVTITATQGMSVDCQAIDGKPFTIAKSALSETDDLATMQKIEGAVLAAQKLIGTPYVWGGRTAEGIDCSGLTQMAYRSQGINLPRDADQQAYVGRMVATNWYRDGMSRGDLMFFISRRGNIGHVAMYLGDNQFIEAADNGVKISSLDPKDKNYEPRREKSFAFARRVIE